MCFTNKQEKEIIPPAIVSVLNNTIIMGDSKNVNTLMEAPLWYNFKQSQHIHHSCQHLLGISHRWLKNVISMEITLLEKQN